MSRVAQRLPLCPSAAVAEGGHRKFRLIFEGRPEECLVIRFGGAVYAYINRCVHMPRPLDCEQAVVFDDSGRYLRCSMHGIVYTPQTGTSVSALCEGAQLRGIEIYEADGEIGVADFRVRALLP